MTARIVGRVEYVKNAKGKPIAHINYLITAACTCTLS